MLLNVLAPAQLGKFRLLAKAFEVKVLTGEGEGGKIAWLPVTELEDIEIKTVWGWTLRGERANSEGVFEFKALHLRPGYLAELIKLRPDAIITNEIGARTIQALLYGSLTRTPVWVWWGGTKKTEADIRRGRKVVRRLVAFWARRWFSYGETSTEYLVHRLGIPADRIMELTHTVDESVFRIDQRRHSEPSARPQLLFVGRLVSRKGLSELLHAAARVQKAGKEFALMVVGEGPERSTLVDLAASLGMENVDFRPAVPHADLPVIYRSADCLVFPTLGDQWGLVVNEALLSGTAVACSIHAGCIELVSDEALFDPCDPDSFDRILHLAVERKLPNRPRKPIPSTAEVNETIVREVYGALGRSVAPTV